MKWLVLLVLVGVAVFFGYPLLNEDAATAGECDALERVMVRLALGGDAAKPQDQLLGQVFQGLSKGQLASVLVRHQHPNVPVAAACTMLYWRAILDPKGFRDDAAKLRS
jgi:hypothetical protein